MCSLVCASIDLELLGVSNEGDELVVAASLSLPLPLVLAAGGGDAEKGSTCSSSGSHPKVTCPPLAGMRSTGKSKERCSSAGVRCAASVCQRLAGDGARADAIVRAGRGWWYRGDEKDFGDIRYSTTPRTTPTTVILAPASDLAHPRRHRSHGTASLIGGVACFAYRRHVACHALYDNAPLSPTRSLVYEGCETVQHDDPSRSVRSHCEPLIIMSRCWSMGRG